MLFQYLVELITMNERLQLEDKYEFEIQKMLEEHQNSIYAGICRKMGFELSSTYRLKESLLKTHLRYLHRKSDLYF